MAIPSTMPTSSTVIETKPEKGKLRIKPGFEWPGIMKAAKAATPEAFSDSCGLLNLISGVWNSPGAEKVVISPNDGTELGTLPMLDKAYALKAVQASADEAPAWAATSLQSRIEKVREACRQMKTHRDTIAGLLMWEIGKPWAAACNDIDRCISGVEWYCDNIGTMMNGRKPLGLVSNIASWNYPLSVLMHAVLVQNLAGNATIAKTPTDGGGYAIGVCMAIARRCGLPVSQIAGPGGPLSEALVRHDRIDCLSFVGGRATGRNIAVELVDTSKRYMLEMEGLNAFGVWEFSQWPHLATQLKKGYDYGKQRCTAYPRFVVQRTLLHSFLDVYFGVVKSLKFGHPAAVANDADPLPTLDFGPLINAMKIDELNSMYDEALGRGAMPVYHAALSDGSFLPGQDTSAYFAPAAVLGVERGCRLYNAEPFGPLDSIVVVDRLEDLVTEMNVSNGSLCCSLATDDAALAARVRPELRGFKFGHNVTRSRGDKEEPFGGKGESWKGCFVGGKHLVRAVTRGDGDDELAGNFPEFFRYPDDLK